MSWPTEKPNEAERLHIYGTAAANSAANIRTATADPTLARKLEQAEKLLREVVLEAGQPYGEPR